MTMQSIETYASQALTCSQKMYLLAEKGDWEGLGKLEMERSLILDSLFKHPSISLLLASVADTLQGIIDIDQKTMSLGKDARQTLSNEMELFKQGKRARAIDAYLGNIA